MRVAVIGATGLIGRRLVGALVSRGDEAVAVVRSGEVVEAERTVLWNGAGPLPAGAFADCDAVVNLAGAPIARRWSAQVRREIVASRVDLTERLVEEFREPGPRVLVNASAVGFYGSGEREVEESSAPGEGFLADLCVRWELAAAEAREAGARVVVVRTGVVLDAEGGALRELLTPARLGLVGPIAGGRQWFPWIHMRDEVGLLLRALDDPVLSGPLNAVAPGIVRQRDFAKELGRTLHRPAVLPTPGFVLRAMLGEGAQVVTAGQRVLPRVALDAGFVFAFPELGPALADLL